MRFLHHRIVCFDKGYQLFLIDRKHLVAHYIQLKVDVYKINLRKDHRIKVGATVLDDKVYETVGYEQNRIEVLAQLQGKDLKGTTVIWTAAPW